MAMVTNGRGRRRRVMSEINITPLTDVCLVLLIIFMTTAKFLGAGESVDVELPGASTAEPMDDVNAIDVQISRTDGIVIEGAIVPREKLVTTFASLAEQTHRTVLISADRYASYGLVYEVMDAARMADLTSVSLAAEPVSPPER